MHLRPVCLSDVPALSAFGRKAFVAAFGHLYSDENLQPFLDKVYGYPAIRTDIENPRRRIQLAIESQAIVGFCKIGLGCSWPDHARGERVFELMQLYADPARTGEGIGACLMDWALVTARANGADEIQLSVWQENLGAQAFYRRYGFERIADIEFWVTDHRDEEFLFAAMI